VTLPLITPPSDTPAGRVNLKFVVKLIHVGAFPEPAPDLPASIVPVNIWFIAIGELMPKSMLNAPEVAAVATSGIK